MKKEKKNETNKQQTKNSKVSKLKMCSIHIKRIDEMSDGRIYAHHLIEQK